MKIKGPSSGFPERTSLPQQISHHLPKQILGQRMEHHEMIVIVEVYRGFNRYVSQESFVSGGKTQNQHLTAITSPTAIISWYSSSLRTQNEGPQSIHASQRLHLTAEK